MACNRSICALSDPFLQEIIHLNKPFDFAHGRGFAGVQVMLPSELATAPHGTGPSGIIGGHSKNVLPGLMA